MNTDKTLNKAHKFKSEKSLLNVKCFSRGTINVHILIIFIGFVFTSFE